jgi:hypothetical protein
MMKVKTFDYAGLTHLHRVTDINSESGMFRKELDYLIDVKHYHLNDEGTKLIPPPPQPPPSQ